MPRHTPGQSVRAPAPIKLLDQGHELERYALVLTL